MAGTFTHTSYDGIVTVVEWSIDDSNTAYRKMTITNQEGTATAGEGQVGRAVAVAQLEAYAKLATTGDAPASIAPKLAGCSEKTMAVLAEEKRKADQAAYAAAGCDY